MKPILAHSSLVAALLMIGGCGDSSGPGGGGSGGGTTTAQVNDPVGDTFGVDSVQWDLTGLTIVRDSGGITVTLNLSTNIISPLTGDSNATFSFVDLDTDQDSTTGIGSLVDDFRPGAGSTGLGVDFYVDLADFAADSTVSIVNDAGGTTGSVRPTVNGNVLTVRIPRGMLGNDDGFLNAAAIVGTTIEPTDIIPENGHLTLNGPGPVAPVAVSGRVQRGHAGLSRVSRLWRLSR